jgi:hypothetical protein
MFILLFELVPWQLKEFKKYKKSIIFFCNYGNHGEITQPLFFDKKPEYTTLIVIHLQNQKRI